MILQFFNNFSFEIHLPFQMTCSNCCWLVQHSFFRALELFNLSPDNICWRMVSCSFCFWKLYLKMIRFLRLCFDFELYDLILWTVRNRIFDLAVTKYVQWILVEWFKGAQLNRSLNDKLVITYYVLFRYCLFQCILFIYVAPFVSTFDSREVCVLCVCVLLSCCSMLAVAECVE